MDSTDQPPDQPPDQQSSRPLAQPSPGDLREALRGVIDPELGDNIVDLGMLRSVDIDERGRVSAVVALTTAACPLRGQLRSDVEARLMGVPGVSEVEVGIGEMAPADKRALMDRARQTAQSRAPGIELPLRTRVLAVSSGKGGVGKSSVAVNLAASLARRALAVGVLDADIWGFSVPRMLGMSGELRADRARKIIPLERQAGAGTLHVVSMGFLADEDSAIMWRGLVLNRAVQQFLEDVRWGDLDYLVVDMPPGTGDVHMGLARMLARTEVLVVTTPPVAAQRVAARAADMARRGNLRVAGVVENMSAFVCDHGSSYPLFGEGGGERLAAQVGVPLLAKVPLHPAMARAGDEGTPLALDPSSPLAGVFAELARRVAEEVAPVVEVSSCTANLLARVEEALDASDVSRAR
ncbi:MAG: Mrp/NBP35 family ATP-binding protein [Actinobacteria bacterium]|nr:Mrp/NBP35 family ATP-binding protein [Actinomycetota bacterium]